MSHVPAGSLRDSRASSDVPPLYFLNILISTLPQNSSALRLSVLSSCVITATASPQPSQTWPRLSQKFPEAGTVSHQIVSLLLWWHTKTRSSLGKKAFILLTLSGNSPSLKGVRARGWRQELMQEPWGTLFNWLVPHGLLGLLFTRTITAGWCHLQWTEPFQISHKENEPQANLETFS